ncbi:type IV pilus assembly protein PilN [Paraburkholderia bannensis]|jgi:type IV pilus assembly protein PilN|uniref:Type IV pilus assembly protein PilN n=1 Tax=Paraburkholderia bannensis TaxID=765414 RepID=A0A7W9U1T7_9BURK|nr:MULTISPECIES: PilN domain-containing protein [Paraburkholderia]MBB3260445.1 type IV pilus assembly protein PilN [Paraburkholderia sp. WP4_3_2]MBB6105481.1 type IV pilus assembly protein PilN [Paraburkholderia bannensis]
MSAPAKVFAWDGFNLLPWRLAAARRLRRRRALEWLAALLIGAALGAAAAGWQAFERTQADARRAQIEQQLAQWGTPLREARRLAREADERHAAWREAQQKAQPLSHFFALIDALARVRTEGVVLDQLIQHADETELQASAADEAAAAAWLERLHALRDIEAVNVRELKREAQTRQTRITSSAAAGGAPIHIAARLVWKGAALSGQNTTNAARSIGVKEAK